MIAIQQDLDHGLQLSNSGREPKLSWSKQTHADNIEKSKLFSVLVQISSAEES